MILRAFQRDFEVNGPSVARIVRTTLGRLAAATSTTPIRGIRRRFAGDVPGLDNSFSARARRRPNDTTATTRRCGPKCRRC